MLFYDAYFTFCFYFFVALGLFHCLGISYFHWELWQLAFDFVLIAGSLESIRPGLVQGCTLTAPNVVG